jgi:hypothetical protein
MNTSARLILAAFATLPLLGVPFTSGSDWDTPSALAQQGKTVDLRPKFTKGQEIRLKLELVNRSKTTAGSATTKDQDEEAPPRDYDGTQEYVLLLKVKDTNPETGTTAELVYEQVKVRMKSAIGDMDFDSTKPKKDDPLDEMLRGMVGASFQVEFDRSGNIKNITGNDPLQGVAGGLGGSPSSPAGLQDFFGRIFPTGSDASLQRRVGESWTTTDTMDAPGGTWNITSTNTVKSASGGKAVVDIKGKLNFEPATSGKGAQIKVQNARYDGTYTWDTERGMLSSLETRQHLETLDAKSNRRTTEDATMKVTRLAK